MSVTGNEGFVEAYDIRTGVKARVPRHFIGDPVVGRFLKKTPSQRVLDGELDEAPLLLGPNASVKDLLRYAQREGIDVGAAETRDDLFDAVSRRMTRSELDAVADEEPDDEPHDKGTPTPPKPPTPPTPPRPQVGAQNPGGTKPPDETPDAGDKE